MTTWRDKRTVTLSIPAELVSNVRIAIEARAKEFKSNRTEISRTIDGVSAAEHWDHMARGLYKLAEQLK